ncbi:MAG: phosphate ABC transporter permease subunit PstC [Desulfopila sp.]
MLYSYILPCILLFSVVAFFLGRRRALAVARGREPGALDSLPVHYGVLTALACAIPAFFLLTTWQIVETPVITSLIVKKLPAEVQRLDTSDLELLTSEIHNRINSEIVGETAKPLVESGARQYVALQSSVRDLVFKVTIATMLVACGGVLLWIKIDLKARKLVESMGMTVLFSCVVLTIVITLGTILLMLFEAFRFFKAVPMTSFLFGLDWSPQIAIRSDQIASSGAFGSVPVLLGTLLISLIAMLVAVPIGLLSAIYLSEYASKKVRATIKPLLEILAGIPTVVYGFFAALNVAPLIRVIGQYLGFSVSSESALAAGLVTGIMLIPLISSIADDVIYAVPQELRDGSCALGATRYETVRNVVIPAALPGIVAGILLAVSRAIGETMIVVMAAGLAANLTFNPLQAVTTVTVQIVTLLVGDQEFDSPKTLAAFALGLLLFLLTLILNFIALRVVRQYREHYD